MDTVPVTASLPPSLCAGDALTLSLQTNQPSTSTYTLALTAIVNGLLVRYVVGASPATIPIDPTGVALLTLPSPLTATWQPGQYGWVAVAIDSVGNRTTLAKGTVVITADPLGAQPADPRSYNRRMLDQIRALRQGKVLDDVAMYKIGTRELTHCTHAELAELEAEYETRCRSERIRNGERVPTRNKGISFGGR